MMRFAIALFALTLVSSCGIRGDLERPGPLWGEGSGAPPATLPPETDREDDPTTLPLPQPGALPPPQ